jgi:hypothetical protein
MIFYRITKKREMQNNDNDNNGQISHSYRYILEFNFTVGKYISNLPKLN